MSESASVDWQWLKQPQSYAFSKLSGEYVWWCWSLLARLAASWTDVIRVMDLLSPVHSDKKQGVRVRTI